MSTEIEVKKVVLIDGVETEVSAQVAMLIDQMKSMETQKSAMEIQIIGLTAQIAKFKEQIDKALKGE